MRAAAKDDAFGWADVGEVATDGDDQMTVAGEAVVGGIKSDPANSWAP